MRSLQTTLNWCGPFINFQPLTIGGVEPAVTIANMVMQTMLGAPFCWRWNRATVTQAITSGAGQDYVVALSDFGFIEKAWVANQGSTVIMEVMGSTCLALTKESGRPAYVSAIGDDSAGNITFRLNTVPDASYTLNIMYQKKATPMVSLASTWSPIPDEMAYIYQWGFLTQAAMINSDSRFPLFNQKFTSHLLGAQDGLDEVSRNIFLGNWLEVTKSLERANMKTQQGIAARQQ